MNQDAIKTYLLQILTAAQAAQAELEDTPPIEDVRVLQPGDNVQAAIDAASPGAVLEFLAGWRYVVGTLTFPRPITLRAAYPLPERRITAGTVLPILDSGGPQPTIDGHNATGVTLQGLAFETRADGLGEPIVWQDAQDIVMDQLLIIGGATNGCKRGIRGNGQNITLRRSHIANIWREGQDSQAFCAWDGAGPYIIEDNYLEAAGENVMFGGSDIASADRIPSDITIAGNTITKRAEWRERKNYYSVKNLLELKCGKRVQIQNNTLSGCWTDAQAGFAVVLKTQNQDGGSPFMVTEDVLVEGNIITDTEGGINILGYDPYKPSGQVTRVTFRHNLIQCSGLGLQLGGRVGDATFERNTWENGWSFMGLYADDGAVAVETLRMLGNVANCGEYGVKGSGCASGLASLTRYVKNLYWQDNVLAGAWVPNYPALTYGDLASVPAGVSVGR